LESMKTRNESLEVQIRDAVARHKKEEETLRVSCTTLTTYIYWRKNHGRSEWIFALQSGQQVRVLSNGL
jgi:hypothetical protein